MDNFTDALIEEVENGLLEKDYSGAFRKDLGNVEGSYVHSLIQHQRELAGAGDDRSIDTEMYRQMILDAIQDAHDTDACRDFRNNVATRKTKLDLMSYVWNVILKGQGLSMKNL